MADLSLATCVSGSAGVGICFDQGGGERRSTSNQSRTKIAKPSAVSLCQRLCLDPRCRHPAREGNGAIELAVGESPHLVSPSCVEKRRRLQYDPRDHQSVKGLFCGRLAVSAAGRTSRNWGYQREAQCGYRAIEVITRHALAAGCTSALGDSVVVQQNPRTGVDVQAYCTSQ